MADAENHRNVTIALTESTKNNPGNHKQNSQYYSNVRMCEFNFNPLDPVDALDFLSALNYTRKIQICLPNVECYFKS